MFDKLKCMMECLGGELGRLRTENATLEEYYNLARKDLLQCNEEMLEHEADYKRLTAVYTAACDDISERTVAMKSQQETIDLLRMEIEDHKAAYQEVTGRVGGLTKQNASLDAKLDALHSEYTELEKYCEMLIGECSAE